MGFTNGVYTIPKETTYLQKQDVKEYNISIITVNSEEDCKITQIENETFAEFSSIQQVDLSNCNLLTIIPQDLFYSCRKLASVILPGDKGSLHTIAGGAFSYTAITNITFPSTLKHLLMHQTKGNCGAFSDCINLRDIFYSSSNSLVTIESYSFRKVNIRTFEVGPYVTIIKGASFEIAQHSFSTITAPNNPYFYVHSNALFSYDNRLVYSPPGNTKIDFPDGIIELSNQAFCNSLVYDVTFLPESLILISSYVFSGCSQLERIFIPNKVTTIQQNAFKMCIKLKSIVIPPSVTVIPQLLFQSCTSLKMIYIPDSITDVKSDAFQNTPLLHCGILCGEKTKALLKSKINLPNSSFSECPQTITIPSHRNIIISTITYTTFFLIF